MLVPVITFLLAWVSYRGAVAAALDYGEMLVALVDLYRFDLYRQLHEGFPANLDHERLLNDRLKRVQLGGATKADGAALYRHG
jgi:hypothetical protein